MAGEMGWMVKMSGLKIKRFERKVHKYNIETILKTPTEGEASGLDLGYMG